MFSLKLHALAMVTVFSVTLAPSLYAGGPFGLFDGCDQACDGIGGASCDSGCCLSGDSGCADSACADNAGCCDSGCDSMGCLGGGCGDYISLFGGVNELDDISDQGDLFRFNDGIALGGAIGRRLGKSWRGELEASFRTNTADRVTGPGLNEDFSGHLYTYAGMANLYYDLHQFPIFGVTPYGGAGLGFAILDGDGDLDPDETDFAYQFMLGTSRELRPGVSTVSEYRYFKVDANPDLDMNTYFFGLRLDR